MLGESFLFDWNERKTTDDRKLSKISWNFPVKTDEYKVVHGNSLVWTFVDFIFFSPENFQHWTFFITKNCGIIFAHFHDEIHVTVTDLPYLSFIILAYLRLLINVNYSN